VEEAARRVVEFVKTDDLVLLKASRAMRLERIGEALKLKAASREQNPEGGSPAIPGEANNKRK